MVYNILMINLEIKENDSGQRLDRFLRKYFRNAPLGYIYKLIRTRVKVNGKKPGQNLVLSTGDLVSIGISQEEAEAYLDKKTTALVDSNLNVVYEDDNILVVDKPAGLLTHETREEKVLVLSNQVIAYLVEKGEYRPDREKVFRPGPANRLDRNTSGLVCFGKNAESARALAKMFRERGSLDRYYMALVHGTMEGSKLLTGWTEKDGSDLYMETHVKALELVENYPGGPCTLVEAKLVTGRTHQIRKQLAEIGYPIVGDVKYGGKKTTKAREGKTEKYKLYLHGWRLVFNACPDIFKDLEGREITCQAPWDRRQK